MIIFVHIAFYFAVTQNILAEEKALGAKNPAEKIFVGQIEIPQENDLGNIKVRYAGSETISDQNGIYLFKKSVFNESLPLYFLIGNGNFWTSIQTCIGNSKAKNMILKHDPKKDYFFAKCQLIKNQWIITTESLDQFNYEIPIDRTILLNANPGFIDAIEFNGNSAEEGSRILLPKIVFKKRDQITSQKLSESKEKQENDAFFNKIIDKTSLRKIKHTPEHENVKTKSVLTSPGAWSKKKIPIQTTILP